MADRADTASVPGARLASTRPAVDVPVDRVRIESALRHRFLDHEHLRRLVATSEQWAPVVLSRSDMTIVDGYHRMLAAVQLQRPLIAAIWFDGDVHDCLLEFLRLNVRKGPGLTRAERHEAVRRILLAHPDWADRRIGELCAGSPKTVAAVRAEITGGGMTSSSPPPDVRVGRDGRARPTDPLAKRNLIVELLREDPEASLRSIATRAGASPETVRAVKMELLGHSPRARPRNTTCFELRADTPNVEPCSDESIAPTVDHEAERAAFIERTDICGADPTLHAESIPLSRAYEIADEARRRASFWVRFADRIDGLPRRPTR